MEVKLRNYNNNTSAGKITWIKKSKGNNTIKVIKKRKKRIIKFYFTVIKHQFLSLQRVFKFKEI